MKIKRTNLVKNHHSRVTRRDFLKSASTATGLGMAMSMPHIRNVRAATLKLRWLGWEPYDIKSLRESFEQQHGVKVESGYFLGNNEAWNRLQNGGTEQFDLVMGDGFWPRQYAKQGLVQPVDYKKLSNIDHVYADFLPPKFQLLQEENGDRMIAAPNCWGGYGLTVNADKVDSVDMNSIGLMFNDKYKGRLATSSRFEENIALTGIFVAYTMNTINSPRPDGKPFNPYVLTSKELMECKRLLIQQKGLLHNRWENKTLLLDWFKSNTVWASPEWSSAYRSAYFDRLDGKSQLNLTHVLKPFEGGLGWVDSWAITSGVTHSEVLELAHKWIDFRMARDNMVTIALQVGCAPAVDVRDLIPKRNVEALFLNETASIQDLYQFDVPSEPEKWKQVWTEVESA